MMNESYLIKRLQDLRKLQMHSIRLQRGGPQSPCNNAKVIQGGRTSRTIINTRVNFHIIQRGNLEIEAMSMIPDTRCNAEVSHK